MAKFLRPRRGTAGVTREHNILLKAGEVYLEIPDDSLTMGRSAGRLIVGDGQHRYNELNYASVHESNEFQPFLTDPSLYTPRWYNNHECEDEDWQYESGKEYIDAMGNGDQSGLVRLPEIMGKVKNALVAHEDSIHNHQLRIINVEVTSETQAEQISDLQEESSQFSEDIEYLKTTVSNIVVKVDNLDNLINGSTGINTRLTTVENRSLRNEQNIEDLDDRLDSLEPRVDNLGNAIGNMRTDINNCVTTVSTLLTTATQLSSKLDLLTTGVTNLMTTVDNYIIDYESFKTTTQNKESVLTTAVSGLQQSTATLNSTLTNVATSVSNLDARIHSYPGRPPRCKNLGSITNSAQMTTFLSTHKIKEGYFEDIEIGDTVYISASSSSLDFSCTYWVAGIDNYYRKKVSSSPTSAKTVINTHHITLFPTNNILKSSGSYYHVDMGGAAGGYAGGFIRGTNLPQYETAVRNTIGNYLLQRYVNLCSSGYSMTGRSNCGEGYNGYTIDFVPTLVYSELPTEVELCGYPLYSSSFKDNVGSHILPLFQVMPIHWWMQYYQGIDMTSFWTRSFSYYDSNKYYFAVYDYITDNISAFKNDESLALRPIICIGDPS